MNAPLPENSPRGLSGRPSFLQELSFSFARLVAGRGWASAMSTPGGMVTRQGGVVVPPPIRYTPDEMSRLAEDYFLWSSGDLTGATIVDVGCGMGTELPTYARRVGPQGRVVAVEAHPRSFAIASTLVLLNDLRNVVLYNFAAWSESEELGISDDAESLGINSVVDSRLLGPEPILVQALPLDHIPAIRQADEISLLKINIEGAEVRALEGARAALARTRTAVVACHDFVADLEGGGDEMRTTDRVVSILASAGFEVQMRDDHDSPAVRSTVYAAR